MPSSKTCNVFVYGLGVTLIVIGIVVGFFWPLIFNYYWKENLKLTPSSQIYKLWQKTPIPMHMEIYLFNWTNSDEFMKNMKLKPKFEEVGPFVFEEVHKRVDVVWNNDKTVSYNQTRQWKYVPEKSVDLSIPITNLNVIATAITKMASNYQTIFKGIVDFISMFYKEKLLITRSANQWLFEGMSDALLTFAKTFVKVPYNKFGWFYGRNMSSTFDGRFNVKTGEDSIYDLGMMDLWNDVHQTNYFDGKCGKVEGSSGELFAPVKEYQQSLTIFTSDFCSPITLNYSETISKEGVKGYRFVGGESVFDNGTKYPQNRCFCSGKCSPSGVRNVTKCRQAPLFISYPHFYLADPVYINAVEGMAPEKSKHEFFLDIEPLSGIPIDVRGSLQLNIHLEPLKIFHMFLNVPNVYVPMLWFRQRAKITPDLAWKGKLLEIFSKMGIGLACGFVTLGFLIIIIRACVVKSDFKRTSSQLLPTSESEDETTEQTSEKKR